MKMSYRTSLEGREPAARLSCAVKLKSYAVIRLPMLVYYQTIVCDKEKTNIFYRSLRAEAPFAGWLPALPLLLGNRLFSFSMLTIDLSQRPN